MSSAQFSVINNKTVLYFYQEKYILNIFKIKNITKYFLLFFPHFLPPSPSVAATAVHGHLHIFQNFLFFFVFLFLFFFPFLSFFYISFPSLLFLPRFCSFLFYKKGILFFRIGNEKYLHQLAFQTLICFHFVWFWPSKIPVYSVSTIYLVFKSRICLCLYLYPFLDFLTKSTPSLMLFE